LSLNIDSFNYSPQVFIAVRVFFGLLLEICVIQNMTVGMVAGMISDSKFISIVMYFRIAGIISLEVSPDEKKMECIRIVISSELLQ